MWEEKLLTFMRTIKNMKKVTNVSNLSSHNFFLPHFVPFYFSTVITQWGNSQIWGKKVRKLNTVRGKVSCTFKFPHFYYGMRKRSEESYKYEENYQYEKSCKWEQPFLIHFFFFPNCVSLYFSVWWKVFQDMGNAIRKVSKKFKKQGKLPSKQWQIREKFPTYEGPLFLKFAHFPVYSPHFLIFPHFP